LKRGEHKRRASNPQLSSRGPQSCTLGKRLLAGQDIPGSPQEGASLIAAAAQNGGGEAAAIAAVLIGLGARSFADWTKALEYLQQAAESGWASAQQQLTVLGEDLELAEQGRRSSAPPDIWGRLRRSIDLPTWWEIPAMREDSAAPKIGVYESFLNHRCCKWLIGRARPRLERSRVFAPDGKGAVTDTRTNSAFEFDLLSLDAVLLLVRARIAQAAGFAPFALENINILHYATGQQFARHFDFLDPEVPGHAQEIAAKGQRVATFLVYLNDEYTGAETEFPLLEKRFRCRTGGALLFFNVELSGAPDRRTLHAGLAPRAGEKWLLSQWIRGRPVQSA